MFVLVALHDYLLISTSNVKIEGFFLKKLPLCDFPAFWMGSDENYRKYD